jgi:selenide,water dikinase
MKRLVLLGGGHAHLFVLEAFARRPMEGIELTLVTPVRLAPYSGMMPGVIAGHYEYDDACVDLDPLARACGCILRYTRCAALDAARSRVTCEDGSLLDYDLLSIDTGSRPATHGIPGVAEYAQTVKPIDHFVAELNAFCEGINPDQPVRVAMVGGGAAGIEVLLAIRHRVALARGGTLLTQDRFCLVSDMSCLLPGFPPGARRRMERLLRARGVEVRCGSPVAAIDGGTLVTRSGQRIGADFIGWATGAGAPAWPRESGLRVDEQGFILVDGNLRSLSHTKVFAAGDVATIAEQPRPKSGVYAVRAGPPLARSLRAALSGAGASPYSPQRRTLALMSGGDCYAIGNWGPFSWEGRWVWKWKDRIDRAFIARFTVPWTMNTSARTIMVDSTSR